VKKNEKKEREKEKKNGKRRRGRRRRRRQRRRRRRSILQIRDVLVNWIFLLFSSILLEFLVLFSCQLYLKWTCLLKL
jgi:hypothetical protein